MKRFNKGEDRNQSTLFPECLDDYIAEDNPVRVIDLFVDELDIAQLGFQRVEPKETGRPAYHPSMLLKLYIYAYLNRVQSSRRIERVAQRNVELMWLTERLSPDHKTIADFRKDLLSSGHWLFATPIKPDRDHRLSKCAKLIVRYLRMCYLKQWRKPRTRIRNLIKLGTRTRTAVSLGLSSKGPYRLARTLATQSGMTNKWLEKQGLISARERWIAFHYA